MSAPADNVLVVSMSDEDIETFLADWNANRDAPVLTGGWQESPVRVLDAHPVGDVEVMWRCTECGKWSHARRRPLRHARHTHDEPAVGVPAEDLGYDYSHETGPNGGDHAGWLVECGPFEKWEAHRA